MRRTRLVAAAFAGSVCLATLAPVAVASEPVAEVSPRRVRPGGTVTITVTCPEHEGRVRYITAYSQAFEDGEADLRLLPRGGAYGKPVYRGRARIASAHDDTGSRSPEWYGSDDSYGSAPGSPGDLSDARETPDAYGSADTGGGSDPSYAPRDAYGSEEDHGSDSSDGLDGLDRPYGSDGPFGSAGSYGGEEDHGSDDAYGRRPSHHGKRYGVNGSCPDGSDFTTSVVVERKPRGGAPAGRGGSRDEVNVAAVAAGGALVSATVGFGVHALRRRRAEA